MRQAIQRQQRLDCDSVSQVGMTKQNLANLVRIGELDNKKDAEPPGYGLRQWS